MTTTLQLLIGTTAISILANHFSRLKESMLFKPVRIKNNQEWYRFFTSGFIHADWEHLLFNLFSLYLFGTLVENAYQSESLFGSNGNSMYLIMYFSAIPFSLLYSYVKYRSKSNYASLGASGAVSAVIFSAILIDPTIQIGLFIFPPIIPGYVFGPLFIILSIWMGKRGKDNINHAAHIGGALYGWLFTTVAANFYNSPQQLFNTFLSILLKKLGLE